MHTVTRAAVPDRPSEFHSLTSAKVSTVLDLPLTKAAEKLGVKRTALKKAYRRRCPGLPWPGTPGVNQPQVRPDVRHVQSLAASGLTHQQQLQQVLARRAVPNNRDRIPLRSCIEYCSAPGELQAAGARPLGLPRFLVLQPTTTDPNESMDEDNSAHAQVAQLDMDGGEIPNFMETAQVIAATEAVSPPATLHLESPVKAGGDSDAAEVATPSTVGASSPPPMPETARGEPQEMTWSGPRVPPLATPGSSVPRPSPLLQIAGLQSCLPRQRLLKGSRLAADIMTVRADGPLGRSLPDPQINVHVSTQAIPPQLDFQGCL